MSQTPPTQPGQIRVHDSPTQVQLEGLLRDGIKVLGTAATFAGATGLAGKLDGLALVVGPLATIISLVWSQVVVRMRAQHAITMANKLDDKDAVVVSK